MAGSCEAAKCMEDWELNRVVSLLFNARRILKRTQLEGPLPDDGDLLRRAFRVAWPSTLESFLVALVSVVDTIMVSSLGPRPLRPSV